MSVVLVARVPDEEDPLSWTWSVRVAIAQSREGPWWEETMCLDTGSPRTQLVDRSSSGDGGGYAESRGVLGSGRSRSARLGGLEFGGVRVSDLEVELVPPEQPGARALLGLDVLGREPFTFRPREGVLVCGDDPPGPTHRLPLDDTGHLRIPVSWPGLSVNAVLDTGAGITVVDTALADRVPQLFTDHGSAPGTDATGTTVQTPTATIVEGRLADDLLLAPHRIAFTDLRAATAHLTEPVEVILGTPAIDLFDWWLDVPGRRWAAGSAPISG
ncbi:aspartyl protease family protein [Ornithinicoccus hortensis]|uniref:Aspartyl protease n=1 Tax=Ornithinicoccus hortensis TaxID=82346 RepID=A0A542YWN7_9MICO|nr:aspartyl protease family protein [Ornithinicoccus hortensis]TQL52384.1 aspartyl protease [Ornithinicoccus hortensis]